MRAAARRWSGRTSLVRRSKSCWGATGALDLLVCLRISRQLADTLAGIDAAQVLHRDIRATNMLVEPESDRVLLADFSTATAQEAGPVPAQNVAIPVGDWAYISPEQSGRMNRPVDYRTDYYSMGVLLYRMLTGQLPWLCRDNGGKARKFRDDKESLRHQRIELMGSGSGHAAVLHLAFPDHVYRLNA
jgi:serine/threonine protein kinase